MAVALVSATATTGTPPATGDETASAATTSGPTTAGAAPLGVPPIAPAKSARPERQAAPPTWSFGSLLVKYLVPLTALGLLVFAVMFVMKSRRVEPAAPPPVKPSSSPFANTVAGAGMIEAQTENIAVGSPLPGLITKVFVKIHDKVAVGAPLFQLDDRQVRAELRYREAMLAAARAEVERLKLEPRAEQIPVNEAAVREAEASVAAEQDSLRRATELFQKRVIPEADLITRQQAYNVAVAKLNRARSELDLLKAGAWKPDLAVAQAAVEQAQAQVEMSKTEIDRLTVRALVAGEVLQVNVRPGEFVGAPHNQPLILLGNVQQLHVRVDIDEHDIPRFVAGRPARACVKGDPSNSFPLEFVSVEPYVIPKKSLTGQNTERVDTRVLQAIYSFDPAGKQLYVGQQLDVYIETPQAGGRGALNVPPAKQPGTIRENKSGDAK